MSSESGKKTDFSNDSNTKCSIPEVETNFQSRHHNLKSQELQAEQFISTTARPPSNHSVYGNLNKGNESLRESTMNLYNSLNASDHI